MTHNSHITKSPQLDQLAQPLDEQALPDAWLYDRSVLEWLADPSLRKQLPFLYQIFGWYSQAYFQITGKSYLHGGRKLFRFLSKIFYQKSPESYVQMQLESYRVFLDPIDMRMFQVVNELASQDTDTRVLSALLAEGDTFLDVGANHGSFAIVASKLVGASGFVLAVEPQPRLAKALEQSLKANALCPFQIHNLAVGSTDGEIELIVPLGTSGSAGVFAEHSATHQYRTFTVPLRRFDELVDWRNFKGKVLLKLDVEGSECAFLLGAKSMITTLKPNLIIEVHPNSLKASGATGDKLKELLQELGYNYYSEMDACDRFIPLTDLNTNIQRNVIMTMM
jgi:FkbM family methyltransferase